MKFRRSPILACVLVIGLNIVVCAAAAADAPLPVDERIVLRIGRHEMSQYILDKYFTRFANGQRQTPVDSPTREAKRHWLELFLAQQLITAYAETQGYSDHAEAGRIVSVMERYMLTQREGPFYQSLYDHEPIPEIRQSRLYANSFIIRQIIIVHFGLATEAQAALGNDFASISSEEKLARIAKCQEYPNAVMYNGPIAWPFEPYCEIGDFLSTTTAGEWFQHTEAPFGIYYGFVQEIKTQHAASTANDKAQFALMIREADKRKIQRQRRAELLSTSVFQIDNPTLARLAERLAELPPNTSQIPAASISAIDALPLFHYQSGDERITVTVGAYCRHFNEMLVRRFPATLPLLRLDAENMAVEGLDFQAACARGIQKSPQFVEDRRGFFGMQMLDLFEKEKLLPTIRVESEEIEHYYQEHAVEFNQVNRIRGRLLAFDTKDQLDSWYRDRSLETTVEPVEISMDKPLPGFEAIHQTIMQGPTGVPWGPVKREKGYAVLIKDQNVATTSLALSEAKPMIQIKLQRQHLDEKELSLAAELSSQFKIEDLIDYTVYGLTSDEVKSPWHQ